MPQRKAEAQWQGTLTKGTGTLSSDSGAVKGSYSFSSRFESGQGTNPEELIGAALAGCFSMAFAGMLEEAGFPPESIRTIAKVSIEKSEAGFSITAIDLETHGRVPGVSEKQFEEIGQKAKKGCPVSRALTGATISLKAKLL